MIPPPPPPPPKVLLGAPDGRLQLWNLRSKKMIYEFEGKKSPILDTPISTHMSQPPVCLYIYH